MIKQNKVNIWLEIVFLLWKDEIFQKLGPHSIFDEQQDQKVPLLHEKIRFVSSKIHLKNDMFVSCPPRS